MNHLVCDKCGTHLEVGFPGCPRCDSGGPPSQPEEVTHAVGPVEVVGFDSIPTTQAHPLTHLPDLPPLETSPSLSLHPPGYEVLGELGRGGMGVVYKAIQVGINRLVALKMILAGSHAGSAELARFRLEAQALGRLQHPNIVAVHEIREHEGKPFFSLEFCDGGSLDRKLRDAPLTPTASAELVAVLARAVAAAHRANVLHRDLKPGNVLLTSDGVPKITDFGLARKLDESSQTQTGVVLGTPSYMAPEQAQGQRDMGPAADIWALGAILYECLTGRPPFKAATPFDTVVQVVHQEPVPPKQLNGKVPRDLETITLKCLQKDPRKRFDSAQDLADDLARFLAGEPIHARPVGSLERLVRWCWKRPAVALLTGLVLGLLVTVAGVALLAYARTEAALTREARQRQEADEQREAARKAERLAREEAGQTRRLLYVAQVQLAAQLWESEQGSARAVSELLERWLPQKGEEDPRDFAWRHQWGLLHLGSRILPRHSGGVAGLAWGSGSHLVTIDGTGLLRRWPPGAGGAVSSFRPSGKERTALQDLAPDGTFLVQKDQRGDIQVVDTSTGNVRHVLRVPTQKLTCLRVLPHGRSIVARSPSGVAWIWDVTSGLQREALAGTSDEFTQTATLSPDGRTVAYRTGTAGGQVMLIDWRKGTTRGPMRLFGTVGGMAFSPDGKTLAVGPSTGEIAFWDTETLQERGPRIPAHTGGTSSLVFSHDGKHLASAGFELSVAIWDVASRRLLARHKGHTARITELVPSADGNLLASGSSDGIVRIWDLSSIDRPRKHLPYDFIPIQVCHSRDGKWRGEAHSGLGKVWDTSSGKLIQTLSGDRVRTRIIRLVLSSHDGMALTGSPDGVVRVWEVANKKVVRALEHGGGPKTRGVSSLAISPDDQFVAAGFGTINLRMPNEALAVRVWKVSTGELLGTLPHGNTVSGLTFSPGGEYLASACEDGQVRLYDVRGWRLVGTWSGNDRLYGIAFSPDGKALAVGEGLGPVQMLAVPGLEPLRILQGHTLRVLDLSFSPDGRLLASASADRTLRLWHLATGQTIRLFSGVAAPFRAVSFSPDGNALAAGASEVEVWSAPSLDEVETLRARLR